MTMQYDVLSSYNTTSPAPIIVHPTIENEKHQEPFKKNMKGDLFEITNYMVKNHVGLLT